VEKTAHVQEEEISQTPRHEMHNPPKDQKSEEKKKNKKKKNEKKKKKRKRVKERINLTPAGVLPKSCSFCLV
jgi:hypothetical protein